MTSKYISGHHDSVLSSHRWRTVQNSAAYLLPALDAHLQHLRLTRPNEPPTLLDVGCGPGTITLDFARLLAPHGGHVVGIDPSETVIAQAQAAAAAAGVTNITFQTGDAQALDAADGAFDVVHSHQVLQHLGDALGALREQRRVCRPGGLVASREVDWNAMAWWPLHAGVAAWHAMWLRVSLDDGRQPDTGRRLLGLCMQAGFARADITATAGTWCYSTPEERAWWSKLWVERLWNSDFRGKMKSKGFGTDEDIEAFAEGFKKWGESEDGWFAFLHGEVVCRR